MYCHVALNYIVNSYVNTLTKKITENIPTWHNPESFSKIFQSNADNQVNVKSKS